MVLRQGWRRAAALLCLAAGLGFSASPASAADAAQENAQQLAGLFMQSCIRFAGDRDGLRDWAKKTGLLELPPEGEQAFLYGLPGMVFDATNKNGKFVVVSEDNGSCSAVAEDADGTAVVSDLEQSLHDASITFKLTAEKTDTVEKALLHREYVASKDKKQWQMLVSTVTDRPGAAMLTANP